MSYGKKLVEMDRDELLAVAQHLAVVIKEKCRDLPQNKEANRRHQWHKKQWGRAKGRMVRLLNRALSFADEALAADIHDELDHQEMIWHKSRRGGKRNTAKNRRKVRRGLLRLDALSPERPPHGGNRERRQEQEFPKSDAKGPAGACGGESRGTPVGTERDSQGQAGEAAAVAGDRAGPTKPEMEATAPVSAHARGAATKISLTIPAE